MLAEKIKSVDDGKTDGAVALDWAIHSVVWLTGGCYTSSWRGWQELLQFQPLWEKIMNFLQAQSELSESIKAAASHFWRLSGDEPNSLCHFLGMEEEELKGVLCLCKVYNGEKDNISNPKNNNYN